MPSLPALNQASPNASLSFRADGKAAFLGLQTGNGGNDFTVVGVDLGSGASEVVDWIGYSPAPGTSVRITAAGI